MRGGIASRGGLFGGFRARRMGKLAGRGRFCEGFRGSGDARRRRSVVLVQADRLRGTACLRAGVVARGRRRRGGSNDWLFELSIYILRAGWSFWEHRVISMGAAAARSSAV